MHVPMDQLSAHLDRGWELFSKADFQGALLSARESLRLDTSSPDAHHLAAVVQVSLGQTEQALASFRRAIELDETFVEAMMGAAEVLIAAEDARAALELVDEALEYCEENGEIVEALLLKSEAWLRLGEKKEAAVALTSMPPIPKEDAAMNFSVGRIKMDVGAYGEAEIFLKQALELEPDYADAHYCLAHLLEVTDRFQLAQLAFLQTLELDRGAPGPAWSLSRELFRAEVESVVRPVLSGLCDERHRLLRDAVLVVTDVPGPEAVVAGVDPRASVLFQLENLPQGEVAFLFFYQQSLERSVTSREYLAEELCAAVFREIESANKQAQEESSAGDDSLSVANAHRVQKSGNIIGK